MWWITLWMGIATVIYLGRKWIWEMCQFVFSAAAKKMIIMNETWLLCSSRKRRMLFCQVKVEKKLGSWQMIFGLPQTVSGLSHTWLFDDDGQAEWICRSLVKHMENELKLAKGEKCKAESAIISVGSSKACRVFWLLLLLAWVVSYFWDIWHM